MKIQLVKTLNSSEILAEPIMTEENQILIPEGTVLKSEYLELLSLLGIDTVYIKDSYEAYQSPHLIMEEDKKNFYITKIQEILEHHIYNAKDSLKKIQDLSKSIVDDLLSATDKSCVYDIAQRRGNLYDHTFMVTVLSVLVGIKLEISIERLYEIAQGCLLHDLGLRYVTVSYVDFDMDNSTPVEFFEWKKHTILAYSALKNETWLSDISRKMILSHHERKNGSGFPLKQKTKEIECNIIQVCDVFDCMISGMECKRKSVQEAIDYLNENKEILFDKKIVTILLDMTARYPVGVKLQLSNGKTAVVLSQTEKVDCPIVGILDEEEKLKEEKYNLIRHKEISVIKVISQ